MKASVERKSSFNQLVLGKNKTIIKMNTFVTFMCFALVATAAAKPAYNYQQPQQSFAPSGPGPVVGSAPQFAQQQFTQQYAPTAQQFVGPAPQFVAPVQQQASYAPSAPVVSSSHQTFQPQQQQTIVSKEIYIHSSPEETEEINADQGLENGPNRKNYKIVFIKAPAHNIKLNLNSLKRAQAANEEKTVIYVLSKKPDLGNLQSQLAAVQTEQKAHKPEVYFIKYKTQEEANRAQQEIQAQYDALGGSTRVSDEGFAPVTSVIGGKSVGINSAGPVLASGSSGAPVFTNGPTYSSGSNFVQSSFQGSQSSASNVSFGVEAPGQKYLPAQKK
ncbi:uncharacterized protein ACRADG_009930 [Cochliomyia hominivorax]